MKKVFSLMLVFILALGVSATAFADSITSAGGSGSAPVNLNQSATTFSVTLPTSLPISMDADGNVQTASLDVYNGSYGPIVVSDVRVVTANGWVLVPFTTDF